MSSLALEQEPLAQNVRCSDSELTVELTDGRIVVVPLAWFPRLQNASMEQRADLELMGGGGGIHWPAIDEDISVRGLLAGRASAEQL